MNDDASPRWGCPGSPARSGSRASPYARTRGASSPARPQSARRRAGRGPRRAPGPARRRRPRSSGGRRSPTAARHGRRSTPSHGTPGSAVAGRRGSSPAIGTRRAAEAQELRHHEGKRRIWAQLGPDPLDERGRVHIAAGWHDDGNSAQAGVRRGRGEGRLAAEFRPRGERQPFGTPDDRAGQTQASERRRGPVDNRHHLDVRPRCDPERTARQSGARSRTRIGEEEQPERHRDGNVERLLESVASRGPDRVRLARRRTHLLARVSRTTPTRDVPWARRNLLALEPKRTRRLPWPRAVVTTSVARARGERLPKTAVTRPRERLTQNDRLRASAAAGRILPLVTWRATCGRKRLWQAAF